MASELSFTATVTFTDPNTGRTKTLQVPERFADTAKTQLISQTVGITEEALEMGDIASPTALMVVNLDPTNFVTLKVATGGALVAKLKKDTNEDGNGGLFLADELASGMQAPFIIADTAPCEVAILVAE